jgi:hypothetical protein
MKPVALAVLGLLVGVAGAAPEPVEVAAFSQLAPGTGLPSPWREVALPRIERRTVYSLDRIDGIVALRAQADASMASVARSIEVDPAKHPRLRWHWRVENLIQAADLRSKDGDDFPARLYVLFDYDLGRLPFLQRTKLRLARALYGGDLPVAALCYVWATREPAGTTAWNAYTDRVRMIVVESGPARLGRWVEFERDVAQDFREAFGEEPPKVNGIAIATDTDNTGERAVAWYGDIVFLPAGAGP